MNTRRENLIKAAEAMKRVNAGVYKQAGLGGLLGTMAVGGGLGGVLGWKESEPDSIGDPYESSLATRLQHVLAGGLAGTGISAGAYGIWKLVQALKGLKK